MPQWTKAQEAAITASNRDILVSAAAGSGKTTVMIERIMGLLCAEHSLERMLIVTFTRAAAGEMRDRLTRALLKEAEDNPHLMQEYERIGQANISTLHTFCMQVLRRHFQEAGTDPLSQMGDTNLTDALKERALEETMDELYVNPSLDEQALIEQFTDENIVDMAKKLHNFLMAQAEPWRWLSEMVPAVITGESLWHHPLYQIVKDGALLLLEGALACIDRYEAIALLPDGPGRYLINCEEDRAVVTMLMDSLHTTGFLPGAANVKHGTLSRKSKAEEESALQVEAFQELRKKFKAIIKKAATLIPADMEQLNEWAKEIEQTLPAQRALAMLVRRMHDRYQAFKAERAVWDYNDLEHQTLAALHNPDTAKEVASQFDYLFVDEYQDISRTQEALISKIHQDNALFMVGDVKQSIYRFRLADPTLFLQKYEAFDTDQEAAERVIMLSQNFRSRSNILHAVNEVFLQTMLARVTEIDYDEDAHLVPGREEGSDPPVELHIITKGEDALAQENTEQDEEDTENTEETAEQEEQDDPRAEEKNQLKGNAQMEAALIARRIGELLGTPIPDRQGEHPCTYRDIVILLRSAASKADSMATILKDHGIPVYNDAIKEYYEMPEIQDILFILQVLDNPFQDVPLLSALSCPAFRFDAGDLARIRTEGKDRRLPFYEVFLQQQGRDDRVDRALRTLRRWRFLSENMAFETFLRLLVEESGLYARAGALPGGVQRRANLRLLCEKARGESTPWTLDTFLKHVSQARKGGGDAAAALGENDNVVRIMTIHKSKGLEFPVVFVADMARSFRFDGLSSLLRYDSMAGLSLPLVDVEKRVIKQTYAARAIKEKADKETRSEEARLLYVAMTRAKERLILIGSPQKLSTMREGWQTPPGPYAVGSANSMLAWVGNCLWQGLKSGVDERLAGPMGAVWQIHWHAADSLYAPLSTLVSTGLPAMKAPSPQMHKRMQPYTASLAPLKTSVTALLKKRTDVEDEEETPDVKRRALEIDLPPMPQFRLTEEKTLSAADRGIAAHKALSVLPLEGLSGLGKEALEKEVTLRLDAIQAQGLLTSAQRASLPLHMPVDFLQSPLGERLLRADTLQREWAFTLKTEDDALVQGVLDACFLEDHAWVLLDYKTDRDEKSILPRYRDQMRWYMRALRALTGKPIKEAWLYALRTGDAFQVTEDEEIRMA